MLKRMDPNLLSPVIDGLSQYAAGMDAEDEELTALASFAVIRSSGWTANYNRWANRSHEDTSDAYVPDDGHAQAFQRDPDTTVVRSFNGIKYAGNYAAKWMCEKQIEVSFEMDIAGIGRSSSWIEEPITTGPFRWLS